MANLQNHFLLEQYTSHSQRHSFATNLAEGGVSVDEIKRYGRWKSNAVVEGYVYNSMRFKRKMAEIAFGVSGDDRGSVHAKKQKLDAGYMNRGGAVNVGDSGGSGMKIGDFKFENCSVTVNINQSK